VQTQGLTKAIRAILSDGEWHKVGPIVAEVHNIIPPEVWSRAYYRRHKGKEIDWSRCEWKAYDIVVRKAIRGLVRIGAVETRREWHWDDRGKIVAVRLAVEVAKR